MSRVIRKLIRYIAADGTLTTLELIKVDDAPWTVPERLPAHAARARKAAIAAAIARGTLEPEVL